MGMLRRLLLLDGWICEFVVLRVKMFVSYLY
jgi:hypothetical protein